MKFVFISHGINPVARKKLINLVGKNTSLLLIDTPTKTYVPTPLWLIESIEELKEIGFKVDRFDIEDAYHNKEDISAKIKNYSVVAVSGGNVFYFLYWAQKVGLKQILKEYLDNGGIYLGESAGAVCQVKDIMPFSVADKPELAPEPVTQGMELTDIIIIPHWNNEKYRTVLESVQNHYMANGQTTYTLNDGQVMFVSDEQIEIL